MNTLQTHEGFLELFATVEVKIKKKLITKATEEELEAILDCVNNVEPYLYRIKKCKRKFNTWKKIFQRKNFTLKKARVLFQKNLEFVASIVGTILSELLNRKISTILACGDDGGIDLESNPAE